NIETVLLQPKGEGKFPEKPLAGAGRERRVQNLAVFAIGSVKANGDIRSPVPLILAVIIESELAGPTIVGLPGGVRTLKEEVGRAIIADDKDKVALPPFALGSQFAEIDAT